MPSRPISTSRAVARLLKERRETLGFTLRAVQDLSAQSGNPIPHSTLARIESGRLDPGICRLQQLLRLYDLPTQVAGDAVDLEQIAGATPIERDPGKLREAWLKDWKEGRIREAMASLIAFKERVGKVEVPAKVRHDATLSFAISASSLGKHRLAKQLLEDLLLEHPATDVLISALLQLSVCWRSLGSADVALAFLSRAAVHVEAGDHLRTGWIEHQQGLIQIDLDDFDRARGHLDRALAAHERAKSPMDQTLVLISFARLEYERERGAGAVAAGRRAATFALKHGFARLALFAKIETARALLLTKDVESSRRLLRAILADTLTTDDNVMSFYAHFYLWKAELAGGDAARADLELRQAAYFVRFVDPSSPEVLEVRRHLAPAKRT